MGKINGWDFRDSDANSKIQLINRQKSALNVDIIALDHEQKCGIFEDQKNGRVETNLQSCQCNDFHYIGTSARKTFTPCMHIYRLAMELGLMEGKYIDRKAQLAQMSPEERRWVEINRLRNLQRDSSQWGGWNFKLHVASVQKDRQYRAYGLAEENQAIDTLARRGVIHGYQTALGHCSCPDFEERILPCKHIYCLALLLGMKLALSYEDYLKQRKSFDEVT